MKKNDISYKNEELNIRFNFRVALICLNNNKILLQKADKDNYWSLIGGRVLLGEDTKEAIIREIKEETGVIIKNHEPKLIKVVENFFTYNNTKFHELLYIYKIDNNFELNNMDNFNTLDKDSVINKWLPLSDINDIDLRPEIIKKCYNVDTLSSDIIK
ncbi:MAG: NUDIX domain-containing protein [Firmicutes bacterium]|nr:NUDIX domain-containing protein [Bacillota bacterium]